VASFGIFSARRLLVAAIGSSALGRARLRWSTGGVAGQVVAIHPHEATLARQRDPAWLGDYWATLPQGRAQASYLRRRSHGRRRARVRGLVRVAQDFMLLAGATNLARFAALGRRWTALTGGSTLPDGGGPPENTGI
jgi:hypothetical protein